MKKAASSTSSDKPVSMDRSSRKRVTSSSSSSSSSPCHSNSTSITSSSSIARRSISNSSCPTVRRLFPAAAAVTTSKHVQKQLQLKQIKPFKVEVEGTNKQKEEEEEEEEEKKEEEEEDDDDELDDDEEDEEEEDEDEEKETESEVEEVDRADSCLSASTSWVPSIRHLSHSPSIRLITNFLNVNQVKEIMEWKNKHKWSFDRSSTTGGITDIRTSFEMEYMGSLVSLLKKRVVILTGMSKQHIEGFQLIRYEKGQEFKPHVDSNNLWIYKSSGMRIYSLIIYLNTMTKKQGGATAFPKLNLQVQPVAGTCLIWKGTLDDMTCDENCEHAGEPVIGGTKFVLVAWVTQHPVWDP